MAEATEALLQREENLAKTEACAQLDHCTVTLEFTPQCDRSCWRLVLVQLNWHSGFRTVRQVNAWEVRSDRGMTVGGTSGRNFDASATTAAG